MKNKKGFTLIELLAVIIILGILMIIAIPSVTRYISDSRKSAYVDTAKEIIGAARNMVNDGKLEMYDTDVTYYIESSCIKTENASKSPYGEFTKAYVVVTYDGNGYTYYWTSNDDSGQGIKNIVRVDKLDTDNVESDLKDSEISTLRGIDGRSKTVVISEANGCEKEGSNDAESYINSTTGEIDNSASTIVKYAAQSANQLVSIGDNNYIFKGSNPNNYVRFNNENWRIIGIYNNQLKIQIEKSIWYRVYNTISPYSNKWVDSELKTFFNTTYYNDKLTDSKSRSMIDNNSEWYVGEASYRETASESYENAKLATWKGIDTNDPGIGTVASYEFLYASAGEGCYNRIGYEYMEDNCGKLTNDWLYPDGGSWTLTPSKSYGYGTEGYALQIIATGYVFYQFVPNEYMSYPSVILKPSVKITGGTGTKTDQYILDIE